MKVVILFVITIFSVSVFATTPVSSPPPSKSTLNSTMPGSSAIGPSPAPLGRNEGMFAPQNVRRNVWASACDAFAAQVRTFTDDSCYSPQVISYLAVGTTVCLNAQDLNSQAVINTRVERCSTVLENQVNDVVDESL